MEAVLKRFESSNNKMNQVKNEREVLEDLIDQAVHDIESPLEAIKYLINELSEESLQLDILKKSLERISDIVSSVKKRELSHNNKKTVSKSIVDELIFIAKEREIAHQNKVKIDFINLLNEDFYFAFDDLGFKRCFVNLLNNAIEASQKEGVVLVKLEKTQTHFSLSIKDSGVGMPSSVLERIGTKGATFNKTKGSGVGVFQAMNFVKSNDGIMEISSKENSGTEFVLMFPLLDLKNKKPFEYVLIDNDELVRFIWEEKAKNKGISLLTLKAPEEFSLYLDRISKNETQIYIDSELDNCVRGEFVAKSLFEKGYKNLFMTTGYEASRFGQYQFLKRVGKAPVF